MNETLQAIAQRYTCRDYLDRMPPDSDLTAIAEAALQAPSARNRQPWQIIVVKDRQLIEDIDKAGMELFAAMPDPTIYDLLKGRGGRLFYNAPCMIVIAIDQLNPSGYEGIDCGVVAQNVVLAATSLGIASTHCGFVSKALSGPRGAEFKERMQFPKGYDIGIGILLGYEKNPGSPHELDQSKITWIS